MQKDVKTNWNLNKIKGEIAEVLIEQLFVQLGYEVYGFGMEHAIPGIIGRLSSNASGVGWLIRKMPDLVIRDPDTQAVYLVEIKFRAEGDVEELLKELADYPYPDDTFITPKGGF